MPIWTMYWSELSGLATFAACRRTDGRRCRAARPLSPHCRFMCGRERRCASEMPVGGGSAPDRHFRMLTGEVRWLRSICSAGQCSRSVSPLLYRTLSEKFLDGCGDGPSVRQSCKSLAGRTHHLAHVLDGNGSDLVDDFLDFSFHFFS